MQYYKVVRVVDDRYFSFIHRDKIEVEYKINEFVRPYLYDSKLYVYKNITDALSHISPATPYHAEIKAFECEVINPITPLLDNSGANYSSQDAIREYWSHYKAPKWYQLDRWKSIALVDAVKLIKEVK